MLGTIAAFDCTCVRIYARASGVDARGKLRGPLAAHPEDARVRRVGPAAAVAHQATAFTP